MPGIQEQKRRVTFRARGLDYKEIEESAVAQAEQYFVGVGSSNILYEFEPAEPSSSEIGGRVTSWVCEVTATAEPFTHSD